MKRLATQTRAGRLWGTAALALTLFLGLFLGAESVAFAAQHAAPDVTSHSFGNSKAVAFLFWLFAAGTLGGAIFVITRRNMVSAVMGMVGTFFCIAGLFLMLYASFLAVMQVLVYAGAIMVLFVFVIMILNRPEAEPWALQGLLGKGAAALGLLYLFKRLAGLLWQVKDTQKLVIPKEELAWEVVLNKLDPKLAEGSVEAITRVYEFGSVEGVGYTLFTKYLFPFEAISIVLLVAVVGAVAIARPNKSEDQPSSEEAAS